jgi:hypothetical protein
MPTTKSQQQKVVEADQTARARLRALEAVQAALDRRDNGGYAAAADN